MTLLEIILAIIAAELAIFVGHAVWPPPKMRTCYFCKKPFPERKMKKIGNYVYCKEHADREKR
jgi:hypothetical protein